MVDKSFVPCKICEHPRKEHSANFGICYNNKGSCKCWRYERVANLDYLEWCYNQKES